MSIIFALLLLAQVPILLLGVWVYEFRHELRKWWLADRAKLRLSLGCGVASLLVVIQLGALASLWFAHQQGWLQGNGGIASNVTVLASAATGTLLLYCIKKRQRQIAETCPFCLGVGALGPADSTEQYEEPRGWLTCRNVLSQSPYEECGFTFDCSCQGTPKLCFPMLGHPGSGKTLWLAKVYRELTDGVYASQVKFDRVPTPDYGESDRIVEEALERLRGPAATQTAGFPRPLLFHFRDEDPWGRCEVTVHIGDYSGETMYRVARDNAQRQQALNADGYLFFLDPTVDAETQSQELAYLREDFTRIVPLLKSRGAPTPASRTAPVAICITKIDLLMNQPNTASVAERFYNGLAAIGPEITLSNIDARSNLVRSELLHNLWPGWTVGRQVRESVQGPQIFFPLTPVGLGNLGDSDTERRVVSSCAILEPLVWLLQMNGYRMLR